MRISHHLVVALGTYCPRRTVLRSIIAVLVISLAFGASNTALAASGTWINTASGGAWSGIFNWSIVKGVHEVATGTGGTADFSTLDITVDNTVHLDSARTIGNLKFGDTSASNNWILDNDGNAANVLTLAVNSGSPTITVNNDTATISAVLAGTQGLAVSGGGVTAELILSGNNSFSGGVTINSGNLVLGNAAALNSGSLNTMSFGAGSTGILDLNGNSVAVAGLTSDVTLGAPVVQNRNVTPATLTVENASDNIYGGVLRDGLVKNGVGAALSLVKNGTGRLTLSGNNTLTGGVTIYDGNLAIGADANLGDSSGALNFGGGGGSLETSVSLTLSAARTVTLMAGGGGFNTDPSTTLTIGQTISGAGGLGKSGAGTLVLGGNNTFTGGVTIFAGTLQLDGNNAFTGGVTINAGTLQLGNAGALNPSGANSVGFGSGSTGTFSLNGNSVAIGNLDTSAMPGSPVVQNASATAATLTIANPSDNTYAGVLQDGPGGGALAITKNAAGTLILSGNNTFTGGVTINAGTIQLGSAGALNPGTPNSLSVNGGLALAGNSVTISSLNGGGLIENASATAATLTIADGGSFAGILQNGVGGGTLSLIKNGPNSVYLTNGYSSFTGAVTINSGVLGLSSSSSAYFTINGGILEVDAEGVNFADPAVTFGSGSTGGLQLTSSMQVSALNTSFNVGTPTVVAVNNVGHYVTTLSVNNAEDSVFDGRLLDAFTLALAKRGAGTLTLGGNNSFTGGVTIDSGTLKLDNVGALNVTSPNAVSFGVLSTGTLALNGYSVTISGLNIYPNYPGTPIVQNANSTAATLTVNGGGAYSGTLQDGTGGGALSLTKGGASTLTLSGADTYSGGTTVIGGTLNTVAPGTLGTGPLTINAANGVTSAVSLGNTQTVSRLSGTGGNGALVTLSIGSGVTLTDNQSSGNTAFQGALINSGTLAKSGTSSLELNSAPTLNSNSVLQVNGGTLRFNFVTGAAAIGTGVTATVASGATLELAGPISALSSGANRVNITNSSNSTGLLVSGTNQQVGNIDGLGTTQVNAGSDLTANHIIQSALIIGGMSGNAALVTIDASDASGNPLGQSSGFALAGSLTPSIPFAVGGMSSASLSNATTGSADLANSTTGKSVESNNPAPVPEPSTLLLALLAVLGVVSTQFVRHDFRSQTV
jgi:fibronectin-binding autotransporter adhesin